MLLEIGLFKKKKKRKEKKSKLHQVWAIPTPISTTKDVICCSDGYIYHFLDYIMIIIIFFNVILTILLLQFYRND